MKILEVLSYLRVSSTVDAAHQRALESGATEMMVPANQLYGQRSSKVRDPFGHEWLLGHEIEKVTPEEMQRRYTAMMTGA